MKTESKWIYRFLQLADVIATFSKDPSTKVGAIITDHNSRIVSMGYNGPPKGVKDDYVDRSTKLKRTIHAEVNAILFAKRDLNDHILYITHPPCAACTTVIIQSGIKNIIHYELQEGVLTTWGDDFNESRKMCEEAGVIMTVMKRKVEDED